jgi:prepilin-type N-terminal cleavage/methylation domain-containing protein
MKRRAVTLTEVLVVIAIVALLAALVLPVFVSALRKSKETPCISNMRQLYTAWSLYLEANNDGMPPTIATLAAENPQLASVLKCPADNYGGANIFFTEKLKLPVSYFYIIDLEDFRSAIFEADPNHAIAYCVVHGERVQSSMDFVPLRDTTGLVMRLRRDGSIAPAKVGHWCSPVTPMGWSRGRQEWSLLSDTHCVEPYCFGLTEPCKVE